MHEQPSCHDTCTAPCAGPPAPISLAEALERFGQEVMHGECDTGRTRCRYFSWGDGAPLVFLHGLADTARSFVLLMAHLSRWFRCIGYDLPSGPEFARYRHADLVADLWALLDHLGIERTYLYAVSFGSTIALEAMRQRPQRMPRAILQAAVACKRMTWVERVCAWLMCRLPGTMASLPLRRRVMTDLHSPPFADRPPERWQHFLDSGGSVPIRTVGRQARMLHRLDLRETLNEVRQPVLLVSGDRDPVVKASATVALLARLPSAGSVVLEGCGHVPSLTHVEPLVQVIRLFLTPPQPCEHQERMPLADSCESSPGCLPSCSQGRLSE